MRGTLIVGGILALVAGIVLEVATAAKLSACSTGGTPTLLGIPGTPTPTGCGGANALAVLGDFLLVAGVIGVIVGVILTVVASSQRRHEEAGSR